MVFSSNLTSILAISEQPFASHTQNSGPPKIHIPNVNLSGCKVEKYFFDFSTVLLLFVGQKIIHAIKLPVGLSRKERRVLPHFNKKRK